MVEKCDMKTKMCLTKLDYKMDPFIKKFYEACKIKTIYILELHI